MNPGDCRCIHSTEQECFQRMKQSAGGYGGNYGMWWNTDPSALSFPNRSALSFVRTGTFPSTKSFAEPGDDPHVLPAATETSAH